MNLSQLVVVGSDTAQWTRDIGFVLRVSPVPTPAGGGVWQVLGLLVPVSSNTSRCFHFRPINPLVWAGALPDWVGERPHLEASFPLRCFQRLSLPNVANQQCTWRYNWHTRGSSVPVLSY